MARPTARLHMFLCGVVWIDYTKRTDIDYKKYLGPNWKPTFDGAGIQVCNHQSWFDIMALIGRDFPSFIAAESVSKILFVGRVATAAGTVYTVRGGTKESRAETAAIIAKRQIEGERGERPIVTIFPEGCTTNGKCMIKMKKGAFGALRAVKPNVLTYK